MVSFLGLWLVLVLQRLDEVRRARLNTAALLRQGAREFAGAHYPLMVALHTLWFAAWLIEVILSGAAWNPVWWAPALAGQILRGWTRATLGRRWTTRILVLAGEQPCRRGPFVWLRHPNYLGVVLELLAFPMLVGAWRTALVFTLLNAALLGWRIRQEELAWKKFGN